jgi:hypothetical protein
MCFLSFVVGFHFSFAACFTYDSEANRIAFGGCLAARCAAVLAILELLLLMLLGSHVRTTEPLSSSIRLACLFTSVVVRSTQRRGSCISASANLDFVTISALR